MKSHLEIYREVCDNGDTDRQREVLIHGNPGAFRKIPCDKRLYRYAVVDLSDAAFFEQMVKPVFVSPRAHETFFS